MAHVLLIEDDPDILALLAHHLRRRGHEVSVAYDGSEGYLSAVRDRPDLIVLDLLLPALTGYQVLDLLRSNPDVTRIPVMVLTALDDAIERSSTLCRGADDCVRKPFDLAVLLARVDRLIAKKKPRLSRAV